MNRPPGHIPNIHEVCIHLDNSTRLPGCTGTPERPCKVLAAKDFVMGAIQQRGIDLQRRDGPLAHLPVGNDLQVRAGLQNDREWLSPEIPNSKRVGAVGFVTAGVTIPIFNRNQGNVEAARAEMERARNEVARMALSIRQSAQPLVQTYLTNQLQAERYKNEMIPRAIRAYRLYLAKYGQMAAAYPQVLVSQRTLFQLEVNYIRTLQSLWANASALRNFTLRGGLSVPLPAGSSSVTINLPNGGASFVE